MKFRDSLGIWREIPGAKGEPGFTPKIVVKQNTSSIYKLEITTEDGTIVTPNLRGQNDGGLDATIVETLPEGENINTSMIYLTLVDGNVYMANLYRDGKWINFGGATTTIVNQVIEAPEFEDKVVEIIDGEVGETPLSDIGKLFGL